jgi:Fe-S cluster assembly scaffold protein SufB
VKVSHSSKTQRIDENKLFYLKSRGLSQQESIKIMIESYFKKTFSCIEMYDKKLFENISSTFLKLN